MTNTQRRIIDAAGALATRSGISSVNADLLAEHAGTSRRTIFNYFASAQDAVYAYLGEYVASKLADADRVTTDAATLAEYLSGLESFIGSEETFAAIQHLDAVLGTGDHRSPSHDWLAHTSHVTIRHLGGTLSARFGLDRLDVAIIGATVVSTLHTAHMIWSTQSDRSAQAWFAIISRALTPLRSLSSFDPHRA